MNRDANTRAGRRVGKAAVSVLAIVAMLGAVIALPTSTIAQGADGTASRGALAARVRTMAATLERDWQLTSNRILLVLGEALANNAAAKRELAEIMLESSAPRLKPKGTRAALNLLHQYMRDDPPCYPTPCPVESLLEQVLSWPPGSAPRETYTQCVVGLMDQSIKQRLRDMRQLATKIQYTIPAWLGRLDYKALGEFERPNGAQCGPTVSGKAVNGEPLSVDWGSKCTKLEQPLKDGRNGLYQPTVASLLYEAPKSGHVAFCTGTLIAPNAVLTAAHCICSTQARGDPNGVFWNTAFNCSQGGFQHNGQFVSALDPSLISVHFQHAGRFDVAQVILHDHFSWLGSLPKSDLAILVLSKPVHGITPTPIDTVRSAYAGGAGLGVGYGWSNPLDASGKPSGLQEIVEQTGLKSAFRVVPTACQSLETWHKLICWSYETEVDGQQAGSTCHGDSGGPLFITAGATTVLAGVTSAGTGCVPGARAYSIEVFQYRQWIANVLATRVPPPSGALARSNPSQDGCKLCQACGEIPTQRPPDSPPPPPPSAPMDVTIRKKARFLHVGVNCTPDVIAWSIKLTRRNTTNLDVIEQTADCPKARATTVANCEVGVSADQKWRIEIKGAPTRDCQIVATTFE